MNNDRRKSLEALTKGLDAIREEAAEAMLGFAGRLRDLHAELESLRDEEQETYDNMPESFQNGDKGQAAEAAASALDTAAGNLDSKISEVEDFFGDDFFSETTDEIETATNG